jgi:hypothetical protein
MRPRNLERRLAQVEQKLAEIQMQSALANCICKEVTIVWLDEEFVAEKTADVLPMKLGKTR